MPPHEASPHPTRVNCLAVYGTLAPGKPNHHQLSMLPGVWSKGTVRGKLHPSGWGAAMGYPGLVLDPSADPILVDLFDSPALATEWPRLDAFEGEGYRRVLTEVTLPQGGRIEAHIYVLAPAASPSV